MKKLSKNAKIMLLIIAVFVVVLICIYLIGARHFSTHFFPGTTINGIDCGEMTVAEVKGQLQERIGEYTLEVQERGGGTEEITGAQLGMEYVDDGGVEALLEQQRTARHGFFRWEDARLMKPARISPIISRCSM